MKTKLRIVFAVLMIGLILTSCSAQTKTISITDSATTSATKTMVQSGVSSSVIGIEATLESIYDQANPSVVNIQVAMSPDISNPGGGALGSGFVWDKQGHIVTNNHVVDGATRITVTFYEGTIVDATLVGTDADSDLAVIKVNPSGIQLQPVTLADSTQVKVGQMAVTIGNPFGLQGTMTVGFISGLGRILPSNLNAVGPSYSIPDIIQTDAPINPGNSGGVLLDVNGKVLGVTSSIDTTTGSSAGVGFAIPSAILQQVVPALINNGHYDHPYLGVSIRSLYPDLNAVMNLPASQRGAMVVAVTAGSPAEKAGLKASTSNATINGQSTPIGGDIIIAYNGQTVKSSDDLITILARSGIIGQTINLTVLRNGNQVKLVVTLGVRP